MFDGSGTVPNLPPPVQPSGPPVHLGGASERHTLPLVARYADVWNCPASALAAYDHKRAVLASLCTEAGRDISAIRVSQQAVLALAASSSAVEEVTAQAERRYGGPGWGFRDGGFIGTPDQLIEVIQGNVARGVTLFIFATSDRAAPATLRLFAEEVLPAFS